MKKWFNNNKKEIFVGIVVFVITSIITKAVDVVIAVSRSSGDTIFEKIRDHIFFEAGRQGIQSIGLLIYVTVFSLIMSATVIALVKGIKMTQTDIELENTERLLNSLEALDSESDEFKDGMLNVKKTITKHKKQTNKKSSSKKTRSIFIGYSVFIGVFIIYVAVYVIAPITLWHTFELSVTKIAPYIQEEDEKMLRSRWVQMNTYDDFTAIDNYIVQVKADNGLE